MSTNSKPKILTRSLNNKIIAGVASGIADYFVIDPTIIRILFVILAFFDGLGIILYAIMWLIVPTSADQTSSETISKNTKKISKAAEILATKLESTNQGKSNRMLGIVIFALGIVFLLHNLDIIDWGQISQYWPLLLILFGVSVFFRND